MTLWGLLRTRVASSKPTWTLSQAAWGIYCGRCRAVSVSTDRHATKFSSKKCLRPLSNESCAASKANRWAHWKEKHKKKRTSKRSWGLTTSSNGSLAHTNVIALSREPLATILACHRLLWAPFQDLCSPPELTTSHLIASLLIVTVNINSSTKSVMGVETAPCSWRPQTRSLEWVMLNPCKRCRPSILVAPKTSVH